MKVDRLPVWFKQKLPESAVLTRLSLLSGLNINTVCKEAGCPNLGDCFKNLRLTFMILGDTCTRNCGFCAVKKARGGSLYTDLVEPYRIAEAVRKLGLDYVVITSVTRQDLADGGAGVFAKTVELIRAIDKDIKVEVLIPDFSGNAASLKVVADSGPCVIGHNMETVKRLHKQLKPQAGYQLSLEVLNKIKELRVSLVTKSSLILGLGETRGEVVETMRDLSKSRCDILTLGQYLAPSFCHYPVREFINPEQFEEYRKIGLGFGFKAVLSGPLVRSSYQAKEAYNQSINPAGCKCGGVKEAGECAVKAEPVYENA